MGRHRKLQVTSNMSANGKSVTLSQEPDLQISDLLNPNAHEIYHDLVNKIRQMGLLMRADCYSLALLANEICDYTKISKQLQDEGFLQTDRDDTTRRNPLFLIRNKIFDNILAISKLFGLTPSNRAGLTVEMEKPEVPQGGKFADRWASI